MINEHLSSFAGLPVIDFPSKDTEEQLKVKARWAQSEEATGEQLWADLTAAVDKAKKEPGSVAWRLRLEGGTENFDEYFERFIREVDTTTVTALVIGDWGLVDDVEISISVARDSLMANASALPALRALFMGDVIFEECEISWIEHCDMAPLLEVFPALEELGTRGVAGIAEEQALGLKVNEHTGLRALTVQSGGLPGTVVREIASSGLPNLERLEVWLGQKDYGFDATIEDLQPVLSGKFERLQHLGLRNSEDTGSWLKALVDSAVLPRLTSADFSLGTLRSDDVEFLLASIPRLSHLKSLDLHRHFLTEDETERVRDAFTAAGVSVDLSEREEPDEYGYYPAVGE